MTLHKSVLLNEVIEGLKIVDGGIYVDATLGYAGHSSEILRRIPNGFLYGFDQDDYAVKMSDKKLKEIGSNYTIVHNNFSNLRKELTSREVEEVDGVLFDLGVSSVQIDEADRGFSFHKDAKLDMRMDTGSDFSAYNVVNEYPYEDLVRILRNYGEEKYANSIAKNIIKAREKKAIVTTFELVDIIKHSMPVKAMREAHPARRTFQAIRIEVNHELEVLEVGLRAAIELLKVGGRVCVISFHSLEDRIVKNIFKEYSEVDSRFKDLPYVPQEYLPKYKIISKGIVAGNEELNDNYRAHSARLRIIERIGD